MARTEKMVRRVPKALKAPKGRKVQVALKVPKAHKAHKGHRVRKGRLALLLMFLGLALGLMLAAM